MKYVSYTYLELDNKLCSNYIAKQYLSREGTGAEMSYNRIRLEEDAIYMSTYIVRIESNDLKVRLQI